MRRGRRKKKKQIFSLIFLLGFFLSFFLLPFSFLPFFSSLKACVVPGLCSGGLQDLCNCWGDWLQIVWHTAILFISILAVPPCPRVSILRVRIALQVSIVVSAASWLVPKELWLPVPPISSSVTRLILLKIKINWGGVSLVLGWGFLFQLTQLLLTLL